jgi:hypothetical protein
MTAGGSPRGEAATAAGASPQQAARPVAVLPARVGEHAAPAGPAGQGHHPDELATLRRSVSSLRTVGTVFLLLGAFAAVAIAHDGVYRPGVVPFVASAALLWVGPGVLYHLTAHLFRRRDFGVAELARWTAIGQTLLAVLVVATSYLGGGGPSARLRWPAEMPAFATIFFAPVLLVQAHQIRTAAATLRLQARTHGFEVQPARPVLPLDATGDEQPL